MWNCARSMRRLLLRKWCFWAKLYKGDDFFALCNAFFRNPSALNFENKIQWIKNVTRKISQMKLSSSWVIVMVGLTYLLSKPNAIVSLRKASWKKSCLFENAASLFLYSPPPFAKDLYFFQFFNHDSWFYYATSNPIWLRERTHRTYHLAAVL